MSKDSVESHRKFAEKYDLPFRLLADPETTTMNAYEVYKEKKMYGKTYMGIERTTYLIDAGGIIRRIWNKVKVEGHAQEVLEALRDLNGH